MRVLFINWSREEYAGGEKHLLALVRELKALGVKPLLLCPGQSLLAAKAAAEGIEVRGTGLAFFKKKRPFPYLRSVFSIFRACRDFKPDIIHAQGSNSLHWLWPVSLITGIPVAWQLQDFEIANRFSRWSARRVSLIIAASEAVGTAVVSRYGLQARRYATIYQGIEPVTETGPGQVLRIREQLQLKKTDIAVAICGRIHPCKGQDIFIGAASILNDRRDIKWLIAGDRKIAPKPYLDKLDEAVARNRLGSQVVFTGFISDMPAFLEAMDIIAVPSDSEPLGLISVEAQAHGLPVIVSNSGGLPESVKHGVTGIVMGENTAACLASQVRLLAGDKSRRERMGSAGRQRYEEVFTIKENALKVYQQYSALIRK